MPSDKALIRRLRSLSYGGNQIGCSPPAYDPQQEVDRRRFQLAEELLKIRAEDSSSDLSDAAQEALKAASSTPSSRRPSKQGASQGPRGTRAAPRSASQSFPGTGVPNG